MPNVLPVRRPTVALVCEAASGGAGTHVLDLAEGLPGLGYDVLLLYARGREGHGFGARVARHAEFGYAVGTIAVGRAPGPRDVVGVWQVRRAIRRFTGGRPVDILHGHSSKGGALARLARAGCARRVVYTPHAYYTMSPTLGGLARRVYGGVEAGLARATDRTIAVSGAEAEHATTLGIPAGAVRTIENGIALWSAGEAAARRAAARRALGVADDELVVGFLGRLAPQKAPDLALAVFRAVSERQRTAARVAPLGIDGDRRARPRVRCVLGGDGPSAGAVRAMLADPGFGGAVTWVPDAVGPALIPAFDILLVPSRYESFPYVLLEALNAGCVVVGTDVGGTTACVVDGATGLLAPPAASAEWGDLQVAADLTARVLALCDAPASLAAMRQAARAHAASFAIERMLQRTADVYAELGAPGLARPVSVPGGAGLGGAALGGVGRPTPRSVRLVTPPAGVSVGMPPVGGTAAA